ncbi:ABC transporter ATP-binding protein [Bacillus sp. FJAT-50079]|uniref:ABC transporter ATP-binding protein n=1 Tax=Bacillus sp. FJAT-50079 TaxID=2833577 RepID=UPI001BCA4CB8|nr:ABC transporter ATP-binding protein [Bacillus sp. FJAT-50079]MBS4208210.1 ABC transporter ATP-binding protein [Bacillus sp. FJAT-50079]
MANAVEMLNITKQFPGVLANDNVSLIVKEQEIHGFLGENGAGKSTLMNILYGLQKPDSGKILLYGKEVSIDSPLSALSMGIGMVHQHFMLVPSLTVLENIILGSAPKKNLLIDKAIAIKKIKTIIEKYNLHVDLDAKVYQLSVGQRQRIEIIKALYRGAKLLILDEPTAVLTPPEIKDLLIILENLRKQGCSIILITHKLKEVLSITSRITVMRKGIVTGVVNTSETNENELTKLLVGREVDLKLSRLPYKPGEEVFRVEDLHVLNERGLPAVKGVSFGLNNGEIIGIAGVEGNGQTELIEAIAGMLPSQKGKVMFKGKSIERLSIRERRNMGLGHVHEDRLKVGGAPTCSIEDNLILNKYNRRPFSRFGILSKKRIEQFATDLARRFSVKVPDVKYELGTLSGGNIQKVIIAREMESDPDVLIASQPTRGVDIGAIEYIHRQLLDLRDKGKSIILVSAELDEIMSLSDRIIVMYEGKISGVFEAGAATETDIGLYMTGGAVETTLDRSVI